MPGWRGSLEVPAAQAFEAWLDPLAVAEWMSGPTRRGVESLPSHFEVDARVGEGFSFVVLRGGEALDHRGRYLAIEPARRLRFTWGLPDRGPEFVTVELRFEATGPSACSLLLALEGLPQGAEAEALAGWAHLLQAIARHLGSPLRLEPWEGQVPSSSAGLGSGGA